VGQLNEGDKLLANIIKLDDYRPEWMDKEMVCQECGKEWGKEWIAKCNIGRLDCPSCGKTAEPIKKENAN
jgi:hypothetical protein